jgi:hypothetical protein
MLIEDAHVVRHWPNVIERTDVVHAVDAGGLIARYRFRDGQGEVICSFPDQTSHGIGRLANPRCELVHNASAPRVVRLGHICAHRHIAGYEGAVAHVAKQEERARWRSYLATEPVQCLTELTAIRSRIDQHQLFTCCPERMRSAFAKLARGPARDLEYMRPSRELVRVPGTYEMEVRITEVVGGLVGMEFWRESHTPHELDELFERLRRLCEVAHARFSEEELRRVYLQARALRRKVTALARWVERGVAFFEPTNMARAERAAAKYLH